MAVKIYIAGPMTGYANLNYPAFDSAAKELADAGYIPLNPATVDNGGEARSWEWYMKRTIPMLLEADGVLLLPGWEDSRGATLEMELADALSIPGYESIQELPL